MLQQTFVYRYLWFIGAPFVAGIWFLIIRSEFRPIVKQDPTLHPAVRRLAFQVTGFLFFQPLVLGIVQLLAGFDDFRYVYTKDFSNPFVLAGAVLGVATAELIAITWLWRSHAAQTICRLAATRRWVPRNPMIIKLIGTALLGIGLISYVLQAPTPLN